MTTDTQNIAICEAIGRLKWHRPTPEEIATGSYYQYEPDFTRDLNAMHEAEKVLTEEQCQCFSQALYDIAHGRTVNTDDYYGGYFEVPYYSLRKFVSATAAQRAEAFLKCLDKWTDR